MRRKKQKQSLGISQILKRSLSKPIPHQGDYNRYAQSNQLYAFGLKPKRKNDYDGDRILNWEDSSPRNKKKQGTLGTLFVTPSEAPSVGSSFTGTVSIPQTGQIYNPRTRTYSGGGGGGVSRPSDLIREANIRQELARKAEATRIANELARAKAEEQKIIRVELDRQVQEGIKAGTIGGQIFGTKTKPFSFGAEPTKTFGVPFITEEERQEGAVGYVVKGDPFAEKDFYTGIQTSPRTPISGLFGSRTRADRLATQREISKAEELAETTQRFEADPKSFVGLEGVETKETPEGTGISLLPSYFERDNGIDKRATEKAYALFEGLSKEQKRRTFGSSVLTGIGSFGVGMLEFGGTLISSLGVQTFKSGEDFKSSGFFGKRFKIGGQLGAFTSQLPTPTTETFLESPSTYLKQKVSDPEVVTKGILTAGLVGYGGYSTYTAVKTTGIKTGLMGTLGKFSPIRTVSKVYTIPITEQTKFDVLSLKHGTGDYTARYVLGTGKTTSAQFRSISLSKVGDGGAESGLVGTQVASPTVYIASGGRVISGWTISGSEGFIYGGGGVGKFTGYGSSKLGVSVTQEKLFGSLMQGYSQPRYNVFISGTSSKDLLGFGTYFPKSKFYNVFRGGTVSGEVNPIITGFVSGRRGSVGAVIDDVYQPTGRYKISPKFTGKEFDINKLFGLADSGKVSGDITLRGKGGTSLDTTFGSSLLSKHLATIQASLTSTIPVVSPTTTSGNIILGVGGGAVSITKTKTVSVKVAPVVTEKQKVVQTTSTSLVSSLALTSKEQQRLKILQQQRGSAITKTATAQSLLLATPQRLKQQQAQILQPSRAFTSSLTQRGFGSGYGKLPIFPPFRLGIPFGDKQKSKSQIKEQRTRYQASFSAAVLGLRAEIPEDYFKKGYGALRIRPISILKGKRIRRKGWIF